MKKIEDKEIENFKKEYCDISQMVTGIIKEEEVDFEKLVENIQDSPYSEEFIHNLSSEENFRQNYDFLNEAYRVRNSELFMRRLKGRRRGKIVRLVATMGSSVAAILLIAFFVFNGRADQQLVSEVQQPILIRNNETIEVSADVNHTIDAKHYELATSVATVEQRLIIPKGKIYTLILQDGSEVILNGGSELLYPSSFSDQSRNVTLKGEAYFKVKKDKIPFVVSVNDLEVRVYGTEFNINAWQKNKVEAVLVSGLVGVNDRNNSESEIKLEPNQLCSYDLMSRKGVVSQVNASDYLAWRENIFLYKNRTLDVVLADIGAWYGVHFEIDKAVAERLMSLRVGHTTELNEMLMLLTKVADIEFIMKSKTEYRVQ